MTWGNFVLNLKSQNPLLTRGTYSAGSTGISVSS